MAVHGVPTTSSSQVWVLVELLVAAEPWSVASVNSSSFHQGKTATECTVAGVTGTEEVSMISNCLIQGLLIAKNAG